MEYRVSSREGHQWPGCLDSLESYRCKYCEILDECGRSENGMEVERGEEFSREGKSKGVNVGFSAQRNDSPHFPTDKGHWVGTCVKM